MTDVGFTSIAEYCLPGRGVVKIVELDRDYDQD
jgi:hypothetical protein